MATTLTMAQRESKKRKRSSLLTPDNVTNDDTPKAKKEKTTEKSDISETEFKFLLSDQNTVPEGLEKFIQSAEAVAAGESSSDIVAGYCRSSQTCSELFTLIDSASTRLKMNEVALVFRCLELILTRIRTDLSKFASSGEAVVQKILAGHMGQVYNCIQEQNKSKMVKAGLQLLIAMVLVSERAKKAVQSRLNFGHVNFPPLFRRRNRKDPQDVRSCSVQLTLAFLQDSDQNTISTLVQQKSFIQMTIAGLKYDRQDLVQGVLSTLLDKVVAFPGLSKTDKVKLFSEVVLKQLCELYDWQGPTGWVPAGKKRQKSEEVRIIPEGFTDDQETIASMAHEFLTELCCSHKHGLNFYDKTVGTGLKNHNQLLGHLVDWLIKKIDEPRKADLVIEILCACPDLIKSTLTKLCPSMTPRWSDKWRELMTWLTKLYRKLPDTPPFLTNSELPKDNYLTVVSMAAVFCLPPSCVATVLSQSIKHDDIRVRDKGAHVIQVLAKKACAIHRQLSLDVTGTSLVTTSAYDDSLVDAFSACVMKTLPSTNQLFVCVDKTMQLMSVKDQKESELEISVIDEVSTVDLSRHASVLLQVLGLYQTLIPSLLSEKPKDLAKLIDMVGCLQSFHQRLAEEKINNSGGNEEMFEDKGTAVNVHAWLPQLYLLKLLSDIDAKHISLGREGLMEKLLLSASQSEKFKGLTVGLVCKMLQSLEIFSGCVKELHVWLEIAIDSLVDDDSHKIQKTNTVVSKSLIKPVSFLAHCLASLINNPSPYVDRVMEVVAETSRSDMEGDHQQDMDVASVGANESAIETILLMDDKELNNLLDRCKPQVSSQQTDLVHLPLSPLAVVALDNLQYRKTVDDTEREYVSRVLVHLLHSLPDPVTLARIVSKSEARLCEGVGPYLQYWTGGKPKTSVTQTLPAAIFGNFTSALICQHFGLKSSHKDVAELTNKMEGMTSQEKLIGLKQILLYVGDTLQTSGQQNKKCEEIIKTYLHLATSLAEHIFDEEILKNQSQDSSWIKSILNTSNSIEDGDALNDEDNSAAEVDVFEVFFSRIGVSTSQSVAADSLKCVLLNPALKMWLFTTIDDDGPCATGKNSPKRRNEPAGSVSELVSEFVSYIITKSKSCSWLQAEAGLLLEYVDIMVEELVSGHLSHRLEEICSRILQSLCPLLDLPSLSRCVVKLLQIPLSSLIGRDLKEDEHVGLSSDTPRCRVLCELLKHLKVLIETDPSFTSNAQMAKLYCPAYAESSAKSRDSVADQCCIGQKECIQIKTTFSFEKSTGQTVSAFAPVFQLLPHCKNENLREFVIFIITWVPAVVPLFKPKVFDRLFKNPLILLDDSQEKRLFVSLIKNVKVCFLLFEEWLVKHVNTVFKREKWNLIIAFLEASVQFSGGYTKTVETLKLRASSSVKKLDVTRFSQSLPCWKLLSQAVQKNDPDFQQLLMETVVAHIRKHEECQLLHFTVLEMSAGFCMQHTNTWQASRGQSSHAVVLDIVLDYLAYIIESGPAESTALEQNILDTALNLTPKLTRSDWKFLSPRLKHMIQNVVRHRLTGGQFLKLVADLADTVLPVESADAGGDGVHVMQSLFEQCVGHPVFQTVMTSTEHTEAKVELVRLLHLIGEMNPASYSEEQLSSVLAASYTASLTLTDQRLLLMMERCAQSKGVRFECPVLWGKAAIEHQSVSEVLGPSLFKQASTQAILEQFNPELMQDSILNFPVRRFHKGDCVIDASEFKSKPQCYDPSFLLRLFVQILSPDKQVPMRLFVERDCLSYLFIALSSHDPHNRLLAYHALNDFYLHADGSRWHEKMEVTFILDLLNASRVKDGQKLSFVVALFFARTVKLLLCPADPLYVPIFRFLVAKPEVDLGNVPEFYKLFFSAGVQYKQERNWMLSLLCDGMRETSDYWLYQKKFLFKIIFSFYDSVLSDTHSQELVLTIIRNACQEKYVAVDLVKNHGLLPWLASAVIGLDKRPEQADLLCDIIHTLWHSLTTTKYLTHPQSHGKKTQTSPRPVLAKTEAMKDMQDDSDDEKQSVENTFDRNCRWKAHSDNENSDLSDMDESRTTVTPTDSTNLPRVPRSTTVEIALVTKSLLWHLSKTSVAGLLKVLQILHDVASIETGSMDSSPGHDAEPKTCRQFQNLLNLSPMESCLLLHHIASAVDQPAIAEAAAYVLKNKGVDLECRTRKLRGKSSSRVAVKDTTQQSVVDVMESKENTSKKQSKAIKLTDEPELKSSKSEKKAQKKSIVSEDEKKHMFQLFHDVVKSTRTLEFL